MSGMMERHKQKADDDLPFITNEKTVNYISRSKVLFIMHGLPESGKSTLVSQIAERYPSAVVCSARDFFMSGGRHRHVSHQAPQAHRQCQSRAKNACHSGTNVVIIDNTNLDLQEMKFYVDLAADCNYTVIVVIPSTWWSFGAAELAKHNKHGLMRHSIEEKLDRFETVLPFYWGWFLNESDSDRLMKMGRRYFSECMRKFPKFCQQMKKRYSEDRSFLAYDDVYSRHHASTQTIHCTACYNGANHVTEASSSYISRPEVKKFIGRVFDLHIIGIVMTPNTIGARVALDKDQMSLWAMDDGHRVPHQTMVTQNLLRYSSLHDVTARLQSMTIRGGPYEKLKQRPRFSPMSGPGSQAHISLGWAQHCQAVRTGLDHLQVVELETRSAGDQKYVQLHGATGCYYGDGQCVVYFNAPLNMEALFSGKY